MDVLMNILCIRYTNKLEIMKTVDVLEYNLNWKWPDKNLPFSYPEFNKSGFNFIEKNEDPYIAFFTLKLFEDTIKTIFTPPNKDYLRELFR